MNPVELAVIAGCDRWRISQRPSRDFGEIGCQHNVPEKGPFGSDVLLSLAGFHSNPSSVHPTFFIA